MTMLRKWQLTLVNHQKRPSLMRQANPMIGGGCTASAIKSLITTRKSSFKAGPAPEIEKDEVPAVAKKRKAKAPAAKATKARKVTQKAKKIVHHSEAEDGDDEDEATGIVTPPSSGIRKESPRKTSTIKYESEDGGLDGMLDEDRSAKASSSSDANGEDGEFDPLV